VSDILTEIEALRKQQVSFVVALIVRRSGSSPREVGARMIVLSDGSIKGTIGGGSFEKLVIDDAIELLSGSEKTLLKKYRFVREGEGATGMCCGGEAEVFMEVLGQPEKLFIFGAGHVGHQLARLALDSSFDITVIDDRDDLLASLPEGIKTVKTNESYSESLPSANNSTYVAIITRSHELDRSLLASYIGSDTKYIGMIGSRAKITKVFESLKADGHDPERLEQVHAPIGMNIGAEGPFEIAVAILAELIAVRNNVNSR
jgi:xanthine dehydrogenase accessory factor